MAALLGIAAVVLVVLPPLMWLGAALLRAVPGAPLLDEVGRRLLLRSLHLASLATGLALLLGVPYGWYLARYAAPGARRLLAGASVLPLLLPPYVMTLAWVLLLSPAGTVNAWLLKQGWISSPIQTHGSLPLAAAMLALVYWPAPAWFTLFAARSVPLALEDAARLHLPDGAAARWAAWPALRPALAAGALLVFLLALADFGAPNSLGVPTYPVEIVNRFQMDRDPGAVARVALPLPLLVIPLLLAQLRWLDRVPVGPRCGTAPRRLSAGRWGGLGLLGCLIPLVLSAAVPLTVLAVHSLPLDTYAAVWAESSDHFVNTALTAGSAAIWATVLALGYGWATRGRRRPVLDLLLTLPYALPAALIGVAMIQLLSHSEAARPLYDSLGGLVWTYVALFFPFALRSLQPGWAQVDPALLDEGALLGADAWTQFQTAAWPALRPYALVGGGIVGLLAAREIDATSLVRPPDGETIAFRIYDYLHYAPGPKVAALSVLLVLIGAVVAAALSAAARDGE